MHFFVLVSMVHCETLKSKINGAVRLETFQFDSVYAVSIIHAASNETVHDVVNGSHFLWRKNPGNGVHGSPVTSYEEWTIG